MDRGNLRARPTVGDVPRLVQGQRRRRSRDCLGRARQRQDPADRHGGRLELSAAAHKAPGPPAARVPSGGAPAARPAPVPPATAAGAAGERGLRSGDAVVLTAGGARFPAGTLAEVVEVFAGGALVEVKAPDGMAERFEVPDSAYERASSAGAAAAGGPAAEGWNPAMPAPASEDWGFDESRPEESVNGEAPATDADGA